MTGRRRPGRSGAGGRRDERGSGSVLVGGLGVLVVAAVWMGVCLLGWLGGARRASEVADLSALAGARAQMVSGDACAAARRTAVANDATVVSCAVDATAVDFVVEVGVAVKLMPRVALPGAPDRAIRTARAGPTR